MVNNYFVFIFLACRQRKTPEKIRARIKERKERMQVHPLKPTRVVRLRRRVGPK